MALALLVLVLPRNLLLGTLSFLRPEEAPVMHAAFDPQLLLEAAYPPGLFDETGTRAAAPVFGVAPGPYRHSLALARGTADGISLGDAVSLVDIGANPVPTLVGRVSSVSGSGATVETLLDPAWRTAVRIGTSSIDALLVGGLTPTLTLIAKGAPVAIGDPIISVDESLPYGLFVGTVAEVRDASDGVLREATIALPYSLTTLRVVDVILDARQ